MSIWIETAKDCAALLVLIGAVTHLFALPIVIHLHLRRIEDRLDNLSLMVEDDGPDPDDKEPVPEKPEGTVIAFGRRAS